MSERSLRLETDDGEEPPQRRHMTAFEGDTIVVQWWTRDGLKYYTREYTVPPKATRTAEDADRWRDE